MARQERVHVKPATTDVGRGPQTYQIPMPGTKTPVPEEGISVDLNGSNGSWWRRRIADGELVKVDPKRETKKGGE